MLVLQFVAMVISDPEILNECLNPAQSSPTLLNGREACGLSVKGLLPPGTLHQRQSRVTPSILNSL